MMFKHKQSLLLVITLMTFCRLAIPVARAGFKYEETSMKKLELQSDDYRGKRVSFRFKFEQLSDAFVEYMVKSGISPKKYYLLRTKRWWRDIRASQALPVIIKRSHKTDQELERYLNGGELIIKGKVKKFRRAPKRPSLPLYYVDVEEFEPAVKAKGDDKTKKNEESKPADKAKSGEDIKNTADDAGAEDQETIKRLKREIRWLKKKRNQEQDGNASSSSSAAAGDDAKTSRLGKSKSEKKNDDDFWFD